MKGVTLTDLQEAEKTMKTDSKAREKKKEEEEKEKEKEAKARKGEEGVRAIYQSYSPPRAGRSYITPCDITAGDTVFAGSQLEVSYRQSAEVRPAGPHAARRHAPPADNGPERYTPSAHPNLTARAAGQRVGATFDFHF